MATKNNIKERTEELLASSDKELVLLGPQRNNYKLQETQEVPTQIAAPCQSDVGKPLFRTTPVPPVPYTGHHNYYGGLVPMSHSLSSAGFIYSQRSQENPFAELEAMLATQNQAQRMAPPKYNIMPPSSQTETSQPDTKPTKKCRRKKAPLPPKDKRHNFYDDEIHNLLDLIEDIKPVLFRVGHCR